ncbi:hypothetical protein MIMGU_mgv1a026112mg [Erythranthe guttata]|uniref:AP2/ERF domain-containing protein n=1 Tax=Erythranthe guttata TaxID=4155 RepID=A0A022RK39_ERYGU|nr:PREDICTED: ethylene-responsive transcription factor RAP2-11 [Erythranthe guttata]EYU39260.1 hypothetical protein MIMGU_mgv1a026112mg [Erythranthe guttata]|eukprot:XP_012835178.1 PREDICTED: ethylene-responsive transcription factor RAP2-11 [Erythranthe guttata]
MDDLQIHNNPTHKPLINRVTHKNTKFVGVRQRPSGKWVAEIKNTTQKIRMWLGTFDTAEEAAHAYDEAACLLRGSSRRTNFSNGAAPCNPALSLKIRNLLHQKRTLNNINNSTSSQSSNVVEAGYPVFAPYKPDLSYFVGGYEVGSTHLDHHYCDQASAYYNQVDFEKMSTQEDGFFDAKTEVEVQNETGFTDFERIKVERQISASLYAMNGVSEYWDNINEYSNDSFWDVTTLCHMFCPI